MVDNDNNPSDGKKQNIQPEKKVVVYSPGGKFEWYYWIIKN